MSEQSDTDQTGATVVEGKDGDVFIRHSASDQTILLADDEAKQLRDDLDDYLNKQKTDLEKAKEMPSGVHVRLSCEKCDIEWEEEYASDLYETPEEHADHPDYDCTLEDVTVEAFCPRHGVVPFHYDECDGCADARRVVNR